MKVGTEQPEGWKDACLKNCRQNKEHREEA